MLDVPNFEVYIIMMVYCIYFFRFKRFSLAYGYSLCLEWTNQELMSVAWDLEKYIRPDLCPDTFDVDYVGELYDVKVNT